MMLAMGEVLGDRYRIVREIGSGGFGRVYLAEELERPLSDDGDQAALPFAAGTRPVLRRVAIKAFAGRSRLRRDVVAELRALCRLSHPHIVAVYDYRLADPAYLAMEYVVGRDLQSWLEEHGPLSLEDAVGVALQVGAALAHAHAVGVLHRDVKPSNVILSEGAQAKLVDFGLARNVEGLGEPTTQLGTPGFVAPELVDPEQFREPVGVTADVYGLGCLLFALLSGQAPFAGDTPVQILRNQLAGERRAAGPLPPLLVGVLERAMAVRPSERFPSVPALMEVLQRVREWLARPAFGPPPDEAPRVDVADGQLLALDAFRHPSRGRGVKFSLAVPGGSAVERGFLYEGAAGSDAREVFESLATAWRGCELSLYGARRVDSAEKGTFLTADSHTVPIVEPHLLVSATDVVKAQGLSARECAARVFVDARDARPPSRAQVVGRLVHAMLDALVEHGPEGTFSEHFETALARARVDAVAAGLGDADLPELRSQLEAPFAYLQGFVGRHVGEGGNLVEASRYSGRYGLEGRVDLALLSAARIDIVELKSGRRQTAEHEAQLRCYTLLWDAFAEANQRGVRGRLLYCQDGLERTLSRQDHASERRILRARNHLVAAHQALARGDAAGAMPYHGQWPERCADAPCRFRAQRCAEQSARMGLGGWATATEAAGPGAPWAGVPPDLIDAARAYHRHFTGLIEIEYLAASRQQAAFTRRDSLPTRIEDGSAVEGARLVEWDAGLGAIELACAEAQRFVPGADVIIHRGDPEVDATLLGRVERVEPGRLVVRCRGAAVAGELPPDGWVVERFPSRLGWRESHRALQSLLAVRQTDRLRALLVGDDPAATRRLGPSAEADPPDGPDAPAEISVPDPPLRLGAALNPAQQAAIALALGEQARPVLVHGPPGTGKTTVIAALVEALVAGGARVLVAAGTNTAVDNVLERLLARGVDFLRLGSLRDGSPGLTLAGDALATRVESELCRRTTSLDAIAERLRRVPVVAGTAHRCIRSGAMDAIIRLAGGGDGSGPGAAPAIPFDVAVVDEATQLTEPLTLGVVLLARRFVLVGDRRQLPPVVVADEARSAYVEPTLDPALRAMRLGGLDRTLFERLEGRVPEAALEVQYRMSREVQALSNRLYYAGSLLPDESAAGRRLGLPAATLEGLPPALRARLDPAQPVVWETLLGGVTGRSNEAELAAVVETIAALLAVHPAGSAWAGEIGVISPFRAQCHAIRQGLQARLGPEVAGRVEVDTVERFQGREKEVMLVSLVVSTWSDFVMDDRRLNVAFTRARSKLVVFGPAQLLYRIEMAS